MKTKILHVGFGFRSMFLLGSFAMVAVGVGQADAQKGRSRLKQYTVQPGDSCWSIAERLFGDGRKYTIIHRYNNLGPLPHLLKPGQKLWLPIRGGGPLGRLTWLHRDVRAKAPRDIQWRRARRHQGLWKLYKVATGQGSSAQIRFVDQSSLHMRPEAILVIYGGGASRSRLKRRAGTRVRLERGTLRGGLARMDREAGLVVETPSSTITLKSKTSQVEVDRLKTSILSVYQGVASVVARGVRVLVPRGHGTWTRKGSRPARPVALPMPPQWSHDVSPATAILVLPGRLGTFDARWGEAPRAVRYHVELAEDRKFNKIVVDAEVGAGVRRFAAKGLRPGTYYAHVSTIDAHRLESRAGRSIEVRVVRLDVSRRLENGPDGIPETVGLVGIAPPSIPGMSHLEVSVDAEEFHPWKVPVILSRPGLFVLRYRAGAEGSVRSMKIRILEVSADMKVPRRSVPADVGSVPVTVRLRDERGRPAVLAGLAIQTPKGKGKLRPTGPGLFRSSVSIPQSWGGRSYPVSLVWVAGVLTRASISVAKSRPLPPRPSPPLASKSVERFVWPHRAVGIGWARTTSGHLGEPARITTDMELATYLADGPRTSSGRDLYLVSVLGGSLAFLDGRLGLQAEFSWFDGTINRDRQTGRQDMGDLWLSLVGVAWRGKGLSVSPVLSATLPTGGESGVSSIFRTEPGVRLDWTYRHGLTLGTNQLLSVSAGAGRKTSGTYASSYHGVWQPISRISLSLELDLWLGLFGQREERDLHAVALSGALWIHLGRGRLGVIGGGGLNRSAWDMVGRYRAGIVAGLGFRGL